MLEADALPAIELEGASGFFRLRHHLLLDHVGEQHVHVVAAEEDVIADGDALEHELAALVDRRDDGEVRGASADVDDEHDVARGDVLAPRVSPVGEPRVEGGLRLLEERQVLETGGIRGLRGELTRRGVEGRGHREHDALLREREVGVALGDDVVPRLDQVLEIAPRRLDRADALDVLRSAGREDRGAAIDGGMAEPALRARDHACRRIDAAGAGVLADDVRARLVPRQRLRAVTLMSDVEEGRQELARLDRPLSDELGDREHLRHGRLGGVVRGDRRIRDGAVGGAEIDPDDVTRRAHSSTSACATMRAS